jgi:hypothetical protein
MLHSRLDFIVLFLAWLPSVLILSGSSRVSDFSFIRAIRILKVLIYSYNEAEFTSCLSVLCVGVEDHQQYPRAKKARQISS